MSEIVVGLDIGANTTKAVWLSKSATGFTLDAALSAPTPVKGMLSEAPLDQEEMAGAIKSIIAGSHIKTKSANIALPENQVYTRVLEMPFLTEKELSSAIYFEAEQYIPVPLNTMTLDWHVLSKENSSQSAKMQVLLVGAPTSLIQRYQKVLTLSGLMPHVVETEILSVVRALASVPNFPNSLVVHIGAVSTAIAIVKGGVVVFTYSIPTGGNAMSRAIASDFGFSITQAEEYKKTYGVSSSALSGKIGKAVFPVLSSLVTEIKKALAFYGEKYRGDQPIMQIILSGGSAKLPGIDAFFAQSCGIESVVASPWNIVGNQPIPKEILQNGSEYTVAIGLAMRGYD